MPAFLQEGLTIHLLVEIPFHLVTFVFTCFSLAHWSSLGKYNFEYETERSTGLAVNALLLLGFIARLALTVYYCVSRSRAEHKHLKISQVRPLVLGTLIALISLTIWILAFGLASFFTGAGIYVFIFWIISMIASVVACILAGLQWGWMKNNDSRATGWMKNNDSRATKSFSGVG